MAQKSHGCLTQSFRVILAYLPFPCRKLIKTGQKSIGKIFQDSGEPHHGEFELSGRSYKDIEDSKEKDLAEDRLIAHVATVEATMVGFFATAVTFLLFPLALYTPDTPFLMYLADLGYLGSWGFLYTIIAGICMRVLSLSARWRIDYEKSMEDLTGRPKFAKRTVQVAMISCVFMMFTPPCYTGLLLRFVSQSFEMTFSFAWMSIIWILGTWRTRKLTKSTI